jgi:Tfp pilus assembly pilus retraction ATPase PilT
MEELSLEQILALASEKQASDIHISEGEYIHFRVHGDIGKLTNLGVIDIPKIQKLV